MLPEHYLKLSAPGEPAVTVVAIIPSTLPLLCTFFCGGSARALAKPLTRSFTGLLTRRFLTGTLLSRQGYRSILLRTSRRHPGERGEGAHGVGKSPIPAFGGRAVALFFFDDRGMGGFLLF